MSVCTQTQHLEVWPVQLKWYIEYYWHNRHQTYSMHQSVHTYSMSTFLRVFMSGLFNSLFTYWRVTVAAKLFPHILSLVIAVERGSGPAVLSFILLKLWSGGSHRRQAIPPNRGSAAVLAQRVGVDAGTFHGEKSLQLKKNSTTSCVFTPHEYLCRRSLRYFWQSKSDLYCYIIIINGLHIQSILSTCGFCIIILLHYLNHMTIPMWAGCLMKPRRIITKNSAYSLGCTLKNLSAHFFDFFLFCCDFSVLVHFQRPHSTVSHHQQGTVFSKKEKGSKSTTCPAPYIRQEIGD